MEVQQFLESYKSVSDETAGNKKQLQFIPLDKPGIITIGEPLGNGAFGTVYKIHENGIGRAGKVCAFN